MADLVKNRTPVSQDGVQFSDPVAAAVRIFQGALVALDAAGDAVNASSATTNVRGVAMHGVDNTEGAAGDHRIETRKGVFKFANNGLTRADIGTDVNVTDNQTVGGAGPAVAGKLVDVDASGAWVRIE